MAASLRLTCVFALAASLTASVSAQSGGRPVKGNPTPGTPQPDPPKLADRITLTGCVEAKDTGDVDSNTPGSSRFSLTGAEREKVVPAGTGGSALTTTVSSRTYRLEGIEGLLAPFIGTKAQVSGELRALPAGSAPPTLVVEFVQKIAVSCR